MGEVQQLVRMREEDTKPAFVTCQSGELWSCDGAIHAIRFSLNEAIREDIADHCRAGVVRLLLPACLAQITIGQTGGGKCSDHVGRPIVRRAGREAARRPTALWATA